MKQFRGFQGVGLVGLSLALGCSGHLSESEGAGEIAQAAGVAQGSLSLRTSRVTTETGTFVHSVALTRRMFVTAMKLSNGTSKSILWRYNNDDTIQRVDSITDSTQVGARIAVARIDDERFVVAMQTAAGALRVLCYSAIGDSLELLASRDDAAITDVDVVGMSLAPGRIVTGDPATLADADFVVGVRTQTGALQLIDFLLTANGSIVRRDSALMSTTITEGSVRLAKVPGPHRMVVTSSRIFSPFTNPSIALHSWSVAANGSTTLKASVSGGSAVGSLTSLSYQRVATLETEVLNVNNALQSTITAISWDVDPTSGALTEHSRTKVLNADPSAVNNVALVSGGSARLFVAYSRTANVDGAKLGTIASVRAADALGVSESTTLSAGFVQQGNLVGLAEEYPILTAFNSSGAVAVTAYRDYNVPLLRAEWLPAGTPLNVPVPADTTAGFSVDEGSTSNDMTLAVGHGYAMSCAGKVRFLDKTGALLAKKNSAEANEYSVSSFFSNILSSLRTHQSNQESCDGGSPSSTNECASPSFDTRCAYDPSSRRFVVSAMSRYYVGKKGKPGFNKDLTERHVAIAVSKSEDPRDGFNLFVTAENKFSDNPTLAISDGHIIYAHRAPSNPFNQEDPDYAIDTPSGTLSPSAYVLKVSDLSAGLADPMTSKITLAQTGFSSELRAMNTGDGKVAFLDSPGKSQRLLVYGFKPGQWGPLVVKSATGDYAAPINGAEDNQRLVWLNPGGTTRSGAVFVPTAYTPNASRCDRNVGAYPLEKEGGSSSDCDARLSILPISVTTTANDFSITLGNGSALNDFTVPCPGRSPSRAVNCARSSVAVSSTQVVMGFRRLSYDPETNLATASVPLEMRTVRFHPTNFGYLDAQDVLGDRSRLAQAGTGEARTEAGFYSTVADPNSTSIWTIGEVSVGADDPGHAFVVKRQ